MTPTRTAMALMTERNLFTCQVEGCNNPAEEAHHALYSKRKGICELNQYENLQLVCRQCHHITGKAKSWENKVHYWNWACDFYTRKAMIAWHNDLPLKVKEAAYK